MKHYLAAVLLIGAAFGQLLSAQQEPCACGANPPGRPQPRSSKPYAGAPDDLRPFSKFTKPYYEHYNDLVEYNGAAREVPDPDPASVSEIRIGFIGPLANHIDEALGKKMLSGAQMAIDEANARGGYGGKPFKLLLHNDSATWGASSNEVVKMVYDEKVWAIFGSISGDTTHIALRVSLKAEVPIVNSASTDPTIPETIIPWYFTDVQDDRVQGYILARRIYTELGLKRIAILRVNDRYGRFGVIKFKDASRRLGHPVVIEQKFLPGNTDVRRQLQVIKESRVDGILLWTDEHPAAMIVKQMRELGMNQPVFGSHRTMGDTFLNEAGAAGDGFQAVVPYDPTRQDPRWMEFNDRYKAIYKHEPEQFAALAYDAMNALLGAICRAGLNRGRIRDTLTGIETYKGVTADMVFDPNCKMVGPMYLATVQNGKITYRPATMKGTGDAASVRPYARVGEDPVEYAGPPIANSPADSAQVVIFGTNADVAISSPDFTRLLERAKNGGHPLSAVAVSTGASWGKETTQFVEALHKENTVAVIALDRNSSHLAEQLAAKLFLPVLSLSDDKVLTSTNVPWIFRLPKGATASDALLCLTNALKSVGPNREAIRNALLSSQIAGMRFTNTGAPSGESDRGNR